jgi:hypothetical protein
MATRKTVFRIKLLSWCILVKLEYYYWDDMVWITKWLDAKYAVNQLLPAAGYVVGQSAKTIISQIKEYAVYVQEPYANSVERDLPSTLVLYVED